MGQKVSDWAGNSPRLAANVSGGLQPGDRALCCGLSYLNQRGVVMRAWVLCLSLGLLSVGAQASVLKSECNLDKAMKNEALNATLGVKGRCDTDKLVRQQKEKAGAEVKKHTTDVLEKKTAGLKEGKSQLQGTQQKVDQAGQQLKQTQQDVKAVAKDPLKAAATAVINQG
ncbi:hypothetical protein COCAGNCG_03015 [Aeromonas dhakensis]